MTDDENDMLYFNSTKGKQKLSYKGYVYQKDKDRGQTCYWNCGKGRNVIAD